MRAVRRPSRSPIHRLVSRFSLGVSSGGFGILQFARTGVRAKSEPRGRAAVNSQRVSLPDDVAAIGLDLNSQSLTHLSPSLMLSTRLLRSARPLPRLFSHPLAVPRRSLPSLTRLSQRLYSDSASNAPPSTRHLSQDTSNPAKTQQPDEPKYSLTFTCKVPECDERTSHMFSKRAYHHGIVIIQCPKCKNRYVVFEKPTTVFPRVSESNLTHDRHLIADNLGWFKDERTGQGSLRNIEEIMRSKGQQVTKGRLEAGDVVEYTE